MGNGAGQLYKQRSRMRLSRAEGLEEGGLEALTSTKDCFWEMELRLVFGNSSGEKDC